MTLDGLPTGEQAFVLLSYAILALLAISLLFGAATVMLRVRSLRDARLWTTLEAKWDPVILDVLEGRLDGSALFELVEPRESLRFLDYLLSYARRIRGNEAARLEELARPFLPLLLERARRGRVERRARAVQTLGTLGMPEFAGVIREALDDPSPLVSMIAAKAVARSGLPEATGLLLERIHRHSDWHPSLLIGLLSDTAPEAVALLRSTLADTTAPDRVRVVVASALADLRDPESAEVAAGLLSSGSSTDLLVACLRILMDVGEERHRDAVLPLLQSAEFPVRSHALEALETLGTTADVPRFVDALDDVSPWVALAAARALRSRGALEPLRQLAAAGGAGASIAGQVLSE